MALLIILGAAIVNDVLAMAKIKTIIKFKVCGFRYLISLLRVPLKSLAFCTGAPKWPPPPKPPPPCPLLH
jgi:hypothetical protein